MSPLDDLTPDLRAALSLVVDRGKSYAEVADLLGIPETAVRERAHTALDALAGGDVTGASPGDAVTGASSGEAEPAGEPFKTGGPRARARTRAGTPKTNTPRTPAAGAPSPASPSPGSPPAIPRTGVDSAAVSPTLPVSRRGGAILLAGILAVIVVVVILVTSSGGSSSHNSAGSGAGGSSSLAQTTTGTTGSSTGTTGTGTTGTGTASAKSPKITKQITLTPPESSSKAIGLVEVLAEGSQHAFYIAAEKLAPSSGFFYVVWLASPTKAEAISKAPNVGSDGRLQGGALLPTNAHEFDKILLTKETGEHATSPGPVVLSGAFSLGH
jgi:hypothetical protein